jgi:short-subunit dehydrogenase
VSSSKTVFIAAISSDIGLKLADLYLQAGYQVIGTYRQSTQLDNLKKQDRVTLLHCDLNRDQDIEQIGAVMQSKGLIWDEFISAVGLLSPIGKFTDVSAQEWTQSITVNSLQQLALLHAITPYKRAEASGKVAFLVGGAINRAFPNYSAYSLGKVMLVKFCELISDENPQLHCVAIGTGWVASKIHRQTLDAGAQAGNNFETTKDFVTSGEQGTKIEDIYALIQWCFDRPQTAGRNFSVVHDDWRDGGEALSNALCDDQDMFRLRRHGNQHKTVESSTKAKTNS